MKNCGKVFILVVCLIFAISPVITGGCISQTRAAKAETKAFLTYEKNNQWNKAWEMLHPDSQVAWGNQKAFIKAMDQPSSNLIRFEIGKARALTSWTNPNTDTSYSNIMKIPVTLVYSTVYGKMKRYQMIQWI